MGFSKAFFISILLPLAAATLLSPREEAIVESLSLLPKRQAASNESNNSFSWNDVKPSKTLVWQSCYPEMQCARLIVPLNYSDLNGEEAVIAMTRVPSPLGPDNKQYRGPILLNPGGPGGSGVDFVVQAGLPLSTILGPQYDILGFDPRGVSRSTPSVSFFQTDFERDLWLAASDPILNVTTGSLAREWARAKVVGLLAKQHQRKVLGHINTDHAARDMLSIVRAHGKDKLLYWGFSYGSVLGATYASIFPNNIERLIIDGVVDIENYYQTLWSTNLLDTDKTMKLFYTYCHASGPDKCSFYAPTPDLIEANLTALYETVRARPVTVHNATVYGIVDYDRLRSTVFTTLYDPWGTWPTLARSLADLAKGNGSSLFGMQVAPAQRDVDNQREALVAIACNDGDPVPEAFEELEKYFKDTTSKSEWAELWDVIRTSCVGWPDFPKGQFRGPFKANTSFPLLVVGNTADPVTPLWAAKKTASGFPSAVVLTQDSPGHASLAAPSLCTLTYIRDYFANGTLPPPDTVCPVIGTPFNPVNVTGFNTTMNGEGEKTKQLFSNNSNELWEAIRKLSGRQRFSPIRGFV